MIDQAAAVAILQGWLDQRRNAAPDAVRATDARRVTTPERAESDRAEPEAVGAPNGHAARSGGAPARPRPPAAVGSSLLLGACWRCRRARCDLARAPSCFGRPAPTDFTGEGKEDIVIQVTRGDSGTVIAQNLHGPGRHRQRRRVHRRGLAATPRSPRSSRASTRCAPRSRRRPRWPEADRPRHPGSGKLVIPEGRQLDDIKAVGSGAVTDGIFTLISEASCVELNGSEKCVSAKDLKAAAGEGPLSSLNVPDWALKGAGVMGQSHRRLEGLIAPGHLEHRSVGVGEGDPGHAGRRERRPLRQGRPAGDRQGDEHVALRGADRGLAGAEGGPSRPTSPRWRASSTTGSASEYDRLEFDSTVNYPLDRQEVATTDKDRATETPWNTYAMAGLPATPICSPGDEALAAAERPGAGGLAVLRDGRHGRHHAVHQRLPGAPGEHRDMALGSGVLNSGR